MLYCDAQALVQYFDERTVRDLLSDSGQPYSGVLEDNPRLAALLAAASGRLEAACLVSGHYTADDLASLSGNAQALAAEICARLTMAALMARRPDRYASEMVQRLEQSAEEYLQQLRSGARLFDVPRNRPAQVPQVDFPRVLQIYDLNQITVRARHFYPDPANRLPLSRMG